MNNNPNKNQLAMIFLKLLRIYFRSLLICVPPCIIGGCAFFGVGYGTGTVNIIFDATTNICEIELHYRGESYLQMFQDESDLQSFYTRLRIAAVDTKDMEGSNGYNSYSVYGGCSINEPIGKADQAIERLQLEYLIPSGTLTIKGNDIVNGPSPKQLAAKGLQSQLRQNPISVSRPLNPAYSLMNWHTLATVF